jgi:hypothetical protein
MPVELAVAMVAALGAVSATLLPVLVSVRRGRIESTAQHTALLETLTARHDALVSHVAAAVEEVHTIRHTNLAQHGELSAAIARLEGWVGAQDGSPPHFDGTTSID